VENGIDNIEKENKEDEDITANRFIMLMIAENGKYSWIVSKELSEQQKSILSRIHAVLESPSYILIFVLYIELMLISAGIYIKKLFR
jgi:hypothetical protein